jgi:hypothetical protein
VARKRTASRYSAFTLEDFAKAMNKAQLDIEIARDALTAFCSAHPEHTELGPALSATYSAIGTLAACWREADGMALTARAQKKLAAKLSVQERWKRRTAQRIAALAAEVLKLLEARVPRREWVDRISPRLRGKNRLSDRQIRRYLDAFGYPSEKRTRTP